VATDSPSRTDARLVAVAHGTRHPVGNRIAAELTRLAGERLGAAAEVAYVELCDPLLETVLAADVPVPTVVVPLLLSTGYHVRVDLPAAAAAAPGHVVLTEPLGPDPLLASAQADRLLSAGARRDQPVTMVAAGSQDPAALPELERAAELLAAVWDAPVRLATLGGLGPRPADVVRPGDAVSPYLLAPGFFATRCAEETRAAGAVSIAEVIGVHAQVVDLVVARFVAAVDRVARGAG